MIKWKENIVIILVLLSLISAAPYEVNPLNDEIDYRLPYTIIPHHYDLKLTTLFNTSRLYNGVVEIHAEVRNVTNEIKLHNRDLVIKNVSIDENYNIEQTNDSVREFLVLTSSTSFVKDVNITIKIEFEGRLLSGTRGFYLSQYQTKSGTTRYLAATQFEPTHARAAFPCFDEPEYKATFSLSITHASEYSAISNTRGINTINGDGTSTTVFDTSPVMPTYLLAFVVSDLGYISSYDYESSPPEVEHRIYARQEIVDAELPIENSLLRSREFLAIMEDKFQFNYTLEKLDSVAVPDHGSAMENFGLILYKEQYLILEYDPHPIEMYDVVGTITHELAHQFFGNVVTCKFWDQIWLNEGFATWLEFILPELNNYTENMRFTDHFNIRKLQNAFRSDSLASTRPMTFGARTPAEISARFDRIAYDKSGAVIRMFHYAIGDEYFYPALTKYLENNNLKSVTSDDFLDAVQSVLDSASFNEFPFKDAFRTWELQKGYPVINVKHNSTTQLFHITQAPYLSFGEEILEDEPANWHIPLSFATENDLSFNASFTDSMNGTSEKIINITDSPLNDNQWYIFNIQQMGYYRVNYTNKNWRNLIQILDSDNFEVIHVLNRAQLVDDALTFAFDGLLSYEIAFDVINYLAREKDFFPWYSAMIHFEKLDYLLKGDQLQSNLRTYVRMLLRKNFQHYGYENNSGNSTPEQFARELVIEWSCKFGDDQCQRYAKSQLNVPNLDKALEVTFLCNGLRASNVESEFHNLYDRFLRSTYQTERLRIIDGLVCLSDKKLVKELLENTIGDDFYRAHERSRIYNNIIAKSSVGLEAFTEFVVEKYDQVKEIYGNIDGILVAASKRIIHKSDVDILTKALDELENKNKILQNNTRTDILRNININLEWYASSHVVSLEEYLNEMFAEENHYRLPRTSFPTSYNISLDLRNVQNGELAYSGKVTINTTIVQPTDKIIIHSKNQEINSLTVVDAGNPIEYFFYHLRPDMETLTIYFEEEISPQDLQIIIQYSTELLTEIDGLYQDYYYRDDDPDTKIYLATTQFQAIEARRAFPCYDEPALKATFNVEIIHDVSYHAVATAPELETVSGPEGTFITRFAETPIMSTYLNAFLVSDFTYISNNETRVDGETLQRIWTRPGYSSRAEYGLRNSVDLLKVLEQYVNTTFTLPKLDSGAIPGKGGGMENYGLILYREAALIYAQPDEDITHQLRQRGVRLIAHEVAHMFFGNLVTGEWWNFLWLNEGFATYLMYEITDILHPTWKMKEFFLRNIMLPYAFITDASDYTRSMSAPQTTRDEINDGFDDIAYDKASCVLRMLHHTVGDTIFKNALHLYLDKYQYRAVNSDHLIAAFEETLDTYNVRGFDFKKSFRTWEDQEGYPLVSIVFDNNSQNFIITQERFFKVKKPDPKSSSWFIPLNFATELDFNFADTTVTHFFENQQPSLNIHVTYMSNIHWYIFNIQQFGYYRVNYDKNNWKLLSKVLMSEQFENIHINNRVQLIDDAFSLASGGYLDYEIAYDILQYLVHEENFFAWDIAEVHIRKLYDVFGPTHRYLNEFVRKLSEKFYHQYKTPENYLLPEETMPVKFGRELAYKLACESGNEVCLNDTYVLVQIFIDHGRKYPGFEEQILCNGLRGTGKDGEYNELFEKTPLEKDSSMKMIFINALGCTDDENLLKKFLESSIHDEDYSTSERRAIFNSAFNSHSGFSVIVEFTRAHEAEMVAAYNWDTERILNIIARAVFSPENFSRFEELVNSFEIEFSERVLTVARTNINAQSLPENVEQLDLILNFLNVKPETTTSETTTTTTTTKASGSIVNICNYILAIMIAFILKM